MSRTVGHVQAKLDQEILDWFDERFAHGFKQQFIEQCFMSLKEAIESGRIPDPQVYPKTAVAEALTAGVK